MISLALIGDVMLGRKVDEALKDHMRPEEPWGDVMPLLKTADLRIINLESAITDNEQPWTRTPKVFHFRAKPSAIETLRTARVDVCSLANNHTLDFEEQGLLDTLKHLEAAGIRHAGAGRNQNEAADPAILTVRVGHTHLLRAQCARLPRGGDLSWQAHPVRYRRFYRRLRGELRAP